MKFARGQKVLRDPALARIGEFIAAILMYEDGLSYQLAPIDAEAFEYMKAKFKDIEAVPRYIYFNRLDNEVSLMPFPDRDCEVRLRFYPHIEEI